MDTYPATTTDFSFFTTAAASMVPGAPVAAHTGAAGASAEPVDESLVQAPPVAETGPREPPPPRAGSAGGSRGRALLTYARSSVVHKHAERLSAGSPHSDRRHGDMTSVSSDPIVGEAKAVGTDINEPIHISSTAVCGRVAGEADRGELQGVAFEHYSDLVQAWQRVVVASYDVQEHRLRVTPLGPIPSVDSNPRVLRSGSSIDLSVWRVSFAPLDMLPPMADSVRMLNAPAALFDPEDSSRKALGPSRQASQDHVPGWRYATATDSRHSSQTEEDTILQMFGYFGLGEFTAPGMQSLNPLLSANSVDGPKQLFAEREHSWIRAQHGSHHLQHVCSLRSVKCPNNCGMLIRAGDFALHLETRCLLRELQCEDCHEFVPHDAWMAHTERHCPWRKVLTTCGVAVPLPLLDEFNRLYNPMRGVSCARGCSVAVPAGSIRLGPDATVRVKPGDALVTTVVIRNHSIHIPAEKLFDADQLRSRHEAGECERRLVICPNACGSQGLMAFMLDDHLSTDCAHRMARCPHGCGMEVIGRELQTHVERRCLARPLRCPYDCGTVLPAQQMPSHKKAECDLRPVRCSLGCGVSMEYFKMEVCRCRVSYACLSTIVAFACAHAR